MSDDREQLLSEAWAALPPDQQVLIEYLGVCRRKYDALVRASNDRETLDITLNRLAADELIELRVMQDKLMTTVCVLTVQGRRLADFRKRSVIT